VTTCERCGHELGIGRFCLNCGHPVGEPVPPTVEPRPFFPDVPALPDQAPAFPSWAPWASGAVLVVVLFAVLASCLGGDDEKPVADDPTTQTTSSSPSPSATETETLRAVDLTSTLRVDAPRAAPPTSDLDGELVSYEAERMLDATPATAWRTPGDATGQTITFTLPEPSTIRRVGLLNGYAKQVQGNSGLVSWYPNNRRITAVEWVFDDGTVVRQDLVEKPKLQRLTINPITTATVQLRLLTVTRPGASTMGRDYTAISDVLVAGTPAA
jgi:hypothetical protein